MGPLNIWIRSEWTRRWSALAGLGVIIALGGGLTLAAVAGARRADSAFDRFTDRVGTSLTVSNDAPYDPNAGLVASLFPFADDIAQIDGVAGIRSLAYTVLMTGRPDLTAVLDAVVAGPTAGADPPNGVVVEQGRFLDQAADDEIMVNEEFTRLTGLSVGDRLPAQTLDIDDGGAMFTSVPVDSSGPEVDFEIVGVYRSVESFTDLPYPSALISGGFIDTYGDQVAMCRCMNWVRTEPGRAAEVAAAIEANPPDFEIDVEDTGPAARSHIDRAVSVEAGALAIAALAAGLAALLVVIQALDRYIVGLRRSWRSLSSVGATRDQLIRGWMWMLAPVVVAGAAGSALLAVALSPLFPCGIARQAEPSPGLRVDATVLVVGTAVVIGVGLALAFLIALARVSTTERERRHRLFVVPWIAHTPPAAALGTSFAVDPAQDRRGLSAFSAVFGLAFAMASVLAVVLIDRSIDEVMDTPTAYGADWDLEMLTQPSDVDATIAATLAEDSLDALGLKMNITDFGDQISSSSSTIHDYPEAFNDLKGSIGPLIDRGRPVTGDDEVMLGSATADELHVDVGDAVSIGTPNGTTLAMTVIGIGRLSDEDDAVHAVVISNDALEALAQGQATSIVGAYARFGTPDAAAVRRLEDLGWTAVEAPAAVANLGQIGDVPALLACALCLLGMAGVVHAMLTALRRRRDDLAITRSLGFTRRQTAATMHWQGVFTAMCASIVGVPIGVIIGRTIWRVLADGAGVADLVTLPWMAVVVVPLCAIGTVFVVSIVLGWRAVRVAHRDPLRSE